MANIIGNDNNTYLPIPMWCRLTGQMIPPYGVQTSVHDITIRDKILIDIDSQYISHGDWENSLLPKRHITLRVIDILALQITVRVYDITNKI